MILSVVGDFQTTHEFSQRRVWFGFGFSLGSCFSVLQLSGLDGVDFDLLSHFQDLRAVSVIGIGGLQILKALVVSMVIVVVDKGADPPLKIAGEEVVLQQYSVLHGLVAASPLAGRRCLQCREAILPWV